MAVTFFSFLPPPFFPPFPFDFILSSLTRRNFSSSFTWIFEIILFFSFLHQLLFSFLNFHIAKIFFSLCLYCGTHLDFKPTGRKHQQRLNEVNEIFLVFFFRQSMVLPSCENWECMGEKLLNSHSHFVSLSIAFHRKNWVNLCYVFFFFVNNTKKGDECRERKSAASIMVLYSTKLSYQVTCEVALLENTQHWAERRKTFIKVFSFFSDGFKKGGDLSGVWNSICITQWQ